MPIPIGQLPYTGAIAGNPYVVDFVGPRPSGGPSSAREFYFLYACENYSLCAASLGSGGFSLGRASKLFNGMPEQYILAEVQASDRFIAYVISFWQGQGQALFLRYIGQNGVPEGPGGDDVVYPVFDTRGLGGISLGGGSHGGHKIWIAGNKLAFLITYGSNLQNQHIITIDLASNGAPTGAVNIPTASGVMRYPTSHHAIEDIREGNSGAVAFLNAEHNPLPAGGVSVVDILSPGLDGQWGNFDDQRWTGGGSIARSAGSIDFSETGRNLVFSVADNRNPNIPIDLEFEDTGPDLVPNTGDDNAGTFTPVGTRSGSALWGLLSVGDFIPASPFSRSSAVRVIGNYNDGPPNWNHTPYFIEAGSDNQLNSQPNQEIRILPGGQFTGVYLLASEQNISVFSYSAQLHNVLFGIRWCYQ